MKFTLVVLVLFGLASTGLSGENPASFLVKQYVEIMKKAIDVLTKEGKLVEAEQIKKLKNRLNTETRFIISADYKLMQKYSGKYGFLEAEGPRRDKIIGIGIV